MCINNYYYIYNYKNKYKKSKIVTPKKLFDFTSLSLRNFCS